MRYLLIILSIISLPCYAKLQLEKLINDKLIELRTDNFIIVTDAKKKQAQWFAQDLENFRYFFTYLMNDNLINTKPLKIIAISSPKNFKRLDLPEFWAGVFLSNKFGDTAFANVQDYSRSAKHKTFGNQTLMHEYVHYIEKSRINAPLTPLWFREGQAEYWAAFRLKDKGKYATIGSMDVIGSRLYAIAGALGRLQNVDVEDLFKTTNINLGWRRDERGKEKRLDGQASGKFYARAMGTYHYLNSEKQLSKKLNKYIQLINLGHSVDKAFQKSFEMSYAEMDEAIHNYLSSPRINVVQFDLEKMNIKFPEIEGKIKTLNPAEILNHLLGPLLDFTSYSYAEKDSAIAIAENQDNIGLEAQISKIRYLATSVFLDFTSTNEDDKKNSTDKNLREKYQRTQKQPTLDDINKELDSLIKANPGYANLYATKAYLNLDQTLRQAMVGHPKAKSNITKLRNLARSAIKLDNSNALAFYVLGTITSHSDENREKFLNEAAIALDSAKLLSGFTPSAGPLWNEIEINTLLNEPAIVLNLSRNYLTLAGNYSSDTGYRRYFFEAHETRATPFGEVKNITNNTINYQDGSVYTGEVKDKLPHGKGELATYFETSMKGVWQAGFLNGQGEFTASNKFHYKGNFSNGLLTGKGELTYPEGNKYVRSKGEFLMAFAHGKHSIELADGRMLTGSYRLGKEHGKITLSQGGKIQHTATYYLGEKVRPISNDFIFVGGSDRQDEPVATGSCYNKSQNKVWYCYYKNGEILPAVRATVYTR